MHGSTKHVGRTSEHSETSEAAEGIEKAIWRERRRASDRHRKRLRRQDPTVRVHKAEAARRRKRSAEGEASATSGEDGAHSSGFSAEEDPEIVVGVCAACGSSITVRPVPGVSTQTETKQEATQTPLLASARGTQTHHGL
ncbi:uncharacterized protein LOC144128244 isoform X2 [Amblyomma americanum]